MRTKGLGPSLTRLVLILYMSPFVGKYSLRYLVDTLLESESALEGITNFSWTKEYSKLLYTVHASKTTLKSKLWK